MPMHPSFSSFSLACLVPSLILGTLANGIKSNRIAKVITFNCLKFEVLHLKNLYWNILKFSCVATFLKPKVLIK